MSGEERTHHWLLTSPGPAGAVDEAGDGGDDDGPDFPHHQHLTSTTPHEVPDEGLMSSPVNSEDLDRDSPLGGGMDDDDDDAGPPSIETQAPDHGDDLEVAGITSSWISSGGHYGGSHSCLGYSTLESALPDPADSSGLNEMPGLELGDFGVAPAVYGPLPFNSPVHESSPMSYGDVTDENAIGGICGLSNLGNTCFMAAGIQCLVNTPPIAQYFFSNWHDGTEAQDTLAGRFSQLTHKIWCGRYSSLRPTDFKHTFGQHWRDFRDYRQHDCQEFVTLLLEGLRKQMCAIEMNGRTGNNLVSSSLRQDEGECRTGSDIRNEQGTLNSSGGIPGHSSPPSSIQSPHCPASPQSPHSLKQPLEIRTDHHEESVGLDSGAASPKSSVSSSSMDAHLVNLRLQPIPEEVLALAPSHRMNTSLDDLSQIGTSCHDAESVTSDLSDPAEVMAGGVSGSSSSNSGGGAGGRRYNVLGSSTDLCDSSDCDTSNNLIPHHKLLHYSAPAHCDSSTSSFTYVEKNVEQLKRNEKNEALALSSSITGSCISTSNSHLSLVKIEDIMKETKTSNVNVLVKDNLPNNELLFDSEKYAKSDKTKLQNSVDNLSKSGQKRVKEVNLIHDKKDCQPMLIDEGNCDSLSLNKRIRLDEKNLQYELERCQDRICREKVVTVESTSASTQSSVSSTHLTPTPSVSSQEQRQAMDCWRTFVGDNMSAVVDTFYGQFKSSLVCTVCNHTSVKYDPFGTLSVPLPHANQIQIPVTYVPFGDEVVTKYLITLCKVSYVSDIKTELAKILQLPNKEEIVIAEVFDNHIARTVEDSYMTKFLNHNTRSMYAFRLAPPPPSSDEVLFPVCMDGETGEIVNSAIEPVAGSSSSSSSSSGGGAYDGSSASSRSNSTISRVSGSNVVSGSVESGCSQQWRQCNICLEEMCQTELKTHDTCEDCLLCDNCIEMSCKHHEGDRLPCPVCQASLCPTDLIPVEKRKIEKPKARLLRVPIVFRVDQESDDNNKRGMQLIGHPCLLALPSRIAPSTLYETLAQRIPVGIKYSLLLVDGRGYNCSRCLFSSHCRGCEVVQGPNSEVVLQAGDTLCIRFTNVDHENLESFATVHDHPSLNDLRQNDPLTLYDCLRAFSQSETLEESDSWDCPKCEQKQKAIKTIAVWRYPPYIIIHLERFLFHGTISTKLDDKVIFPLDGLDLSDYVAGESEGGQLYSLYACVCHMGVAQAGHYTAFARNAVTGEWHYFNDDSVTRQKPREEEYSTAYLLFYQRQGTKYDLHLPKKFAYVDELTEKSSENNSAPSTSNTEQPCVYFTDEFFDNLHEEILDTLQDSVIEV